VPASSGGETPDDVAAAAVEQREVGTQIVQIDLERDRETRIVAAPALPPEIKDQQPAKTRARRARSRAAEGEAAPEQPGLPTRFALEESAVSRDLDEVLERIKLLYVKLDRVDRWLFYTVSLTMVATLLPWVYVPGTGLLSGIQDPIGVVAAAAAALGLVAFCSRAWRQLRSGGLVLLELSAALGVAAASIYRALTLDGSPSVGLYLSLAAGCGGFWLGIWRLIR
jgi:hypothetical protein